MRQRSTSSTQHYRKHTIPERCRATVTLHATRYDNDGSDIIRKCAAVAFVESYCVSDSKSKRSEEKSKFSSDDLGEFGLLLVTGISLVLDRLGQRTLILFYSSSKFVYRQEPYPLSRC